MPFKYFYLNVHTFLHRVSKQNHSESAASLIAFILHFFNEGLFVLFVFIRLNFFEPNRLYHFLSRVFFRYDFSCFALECRIPFKGYLIDH